MILIIVIQEIVFLLICWLFSLFVSYQPLRDLLALPFRSFVRWCFPPLFCTSPSKRLVCRCLCYDVCYLSQWDESRRSRRPDTWSTVSSRLVGDGELPEVVSDHLWLDLDLVEGVSVVNSDDGSDHLWNDDHVSQVCSHGLWLLSGWSLLLSLVELLNQSVSLALQTTLEPKQRRNKESGQLSVFPSKKTRGIKGERRGLSFFQQQAQASRRERIVKIVEIRTYVSLPLGLVSVF